MENIYNINAQKELESYCKNLARNFSSHDIIRVDLHCHDHNSDTPDEIWGRILKLPETWLPTDVLVKRLKERVNAFVITNHNNARSCYDLLDRGYDAIVGAEFSVQFPKMDLMAHVLCYGFTPEEETFLQKYREDGIKFLLYAREHNLPTILPHPLFLYGHSRKIPVEVYEQFALLFQNFEVINGQRDSYQNYLVSEWVKSLNQEKIDGYQKKYGLNPKDFCLDPYKKRAFGGSDDHYGIFCGNTGTLFNIPDFLDYRLNKYSMSEIVLNAIRYADTAPFGTPTNDEKLGIQFLNFFCEAVQKMEDPGLLRMLMHQGTAKDKLACFALCNGLNEIRRHKYTSKFIKIFADAFQGKQPGLLRKITMHPDYKSMFMDVVDIANIAAKNPKDSHILFTKSLEQMSHKMNVLMSERIEKMRAENKLDFMDTLSPEKLLQSFEMPAIARNFVSTRSAKGSNIPTPGVALDQLSFPTLATILLTGTRFAAAAVNNQNRRLVEDFTKFIGKGERPKRMLWLTDSLFDKNGVSSVLQAVLKEVRKDNLPIDFLVCDKWQESAKNLHVIKPIGSFSLPALSEKEFNIPDILEIQKIFTEGNYDRIMVSTEFCMGLVGLYLKKAFNVPAFMLMHTDWLDYIKRTVKADTHLQDRCRRLLRGLYRSYDGIFTLNSEHAEWLHGPSMRIPESRIFKTAHWTNEVFKCPTEFVAHDYDKPVLLYAGRLSDEKGAMLLPEIFNSIRKEFPYIRLKIAGIGKNETELKKQLPSAEFMGWLPQDELAKLYSECDLLILPSSFDTFGMVILEAMSCGLPAASFNCKGPKDLISDGENGILAEDVKELTDKIKFALRVHKLQEFRQNALIDAKKFNSTDIINKMMENCGF